MTQTFFCRNWTFLQQLSKTRLKKVVGERKVNKNSTWEKLNQCVVVESWVMTEKTHQRVCWWYQNHGPWVFVVVGSIRQMFATVFHGFSLVGSLSNFQKGRYLCHNQCWNQDMGRANEMRKLRSGDSEIPLKFPEMWTCYLLSNSVDPRKLPLNLKETTWKRKNIFKLSSLEVPCWISRVSFFFCWVCPRSGNFSVTRKPGHVEQHQSHPQ